MERLKAGQFRAEGIGTIFEVLLSQMEANGGSVISTSLGYNTPGDSVEPGDYVPVITLSLRRADGVGR
jgi:hypothetical protein